MMKIIPRTFDRSDKEWAYKMVGVDTIDMCSDRAEGESKVKELLASLVDKKHGYNCEDGYWWVREDGFRKYIYTIE
jgi:hypothetical protein